ncbi:hypothetical protein [Cupriavidus sp. TMH.W2]|uniref:hypothetical protein n=1 Tax=Cupriavidus sp. TMH.W2 TaxID=3434465 RepID=UPI003D7873BA
MKRMTGTLALLAVLASAVGVVACCASQFCATKRRLPKRDSPRFEPVPPGWQAGSNVYYFDEHGRTADFSEQFRALLLEHVEAFHVVADDGTHLVQVRVAGANPQCSLGVPGTPDQASLWVDVTNEVDPPVRRKLRAFSQGTTENDPLPRLLPVSTDAPAIVPRNPTALRLVLHGGCL